jgi:Putative zinc-finger
MNCRDAELLLQLAADNELTEDEHVALEMHLTDCVACRRKEAWLELLDEHFEPASNVIIEDGLHVSDQVVAALGQSSLSAEELSPHEMPRRGRLVQFRLNSKPGGVLARYAKAVFKKWFSDKPKKKLPPPTSLEKFRALRNTIESTQETVKGVRSAGRGISVAVSVPVRGLRWALPQLARRDKS